MRGAARSGYPEAKRPPGSRIPAEVPVPAGVTIALMRQLPMRRSWLHGLLVAGLCLAFLLQGLFGSRRKSPTIDEPNHIVSGASYIANRSITANPEHPPLLKELSGLSLALAGMRLPAGKPPAGLGTNRRLCLSVRRRCRAGPLLGTASALTAFHVPGTPDLLVGTGIGRPRSRTLRALFVCRRPDHGGAFLPGNNRRRRHHP